MGLKGETYKQRTMSQLENWAQGKSIHNKKDDECCPDFSCCNKKMDTPLSERKTFMELYKEGGINAIAHLSAEYLGKAIVTAGHKVKTSRPLKHFEDDGAYAD
jgi:hypothetical protein